MDELYAFLAKKKIPGKLIFSKIGGSRSHNCDRPDSDHDFMGVYLCKTAQIVSLNPPPEGMDHDTAEGAEKTEADHSFYEVSKFCLLLLKGNPNVVEMLYTEKLSEWTGEWTELRERRGDFLTHTAVKHYLGYLQGQMKRIEGQLKGGGTYKEKWAYHAMRLLNDCTRIAKGEAPTVWKDGDERDFLMKIRNYEFAWSDVKQWLDDGIAAVEALKPWKCPEEPNKEFLNDWLVNLRWKNW